MRDTHPETDLEVEVFRSGAYGAKGSYSEQDIDHLARDYDPARHEAPVTVDHAQTGPALGWVRSLRRVNDRLVALLTRVSPRLREWLGSGAYRKCSVELYREFPTASGRPYLKAVSFLGAAAPEIKDLRPPVFSEPAAPSPQSSAATGESRPGQPNPGILWMSESPELAPLVPNPAPAAPAAPERAQALLQRLRASQRWQPSWDRLGVRDFAETLARIDESAPGTRSFDWFASFLEELPPAVSFGESAGPDSGSFDDPDAPTPAVAFAAGHSGTVSPRSLELHRAAQRYQARNPGAPYSEALREAARALRP